MRVAVRAIRAIITDMAQDEIKKISVFDQKLLRLRRDRAAKHLHKADFLLKRTAEEMGERLLEINRTFRRLLDLGTSHGAIWDTFSADSTFASILDNIDFRVSTDLSGAMLPNHRSAPNRTCASVMCSEEAIPFANNAFDLILSPLVLHNVNDLPGALIQLRECLQPDGLLIASFFGGETLKELRQSMTEAELEVEGGASPHVSPFAAVRDVGSLLQRTGYALPVVDADKVTVWYDNLFKLAGDLRMMGQTNTLIERRRSPLARATFTRAAQLYQERFQGESGKIPATFEIIYATGWAPHASQQKPLKPGSATARMADAIAASAKKNPIENA